MVDACLKSNAHYLDITGEIPVFKSIFERTDEALEADVALIPGMGFDVVPTDCLASYVADGVEDPTNLKILLDADISPSKGTLVTAIDQLTSGGWSRQNGQLVSVPLAHESFEADFPQGRIRAVSAPLGDLVTVFHSTGVPNIDTFVNLPLPFSDFMGPFVRGFSSLLKVPYLKEALQTGVEGVSSLTWSDEEDTEESENWIYARAENDAGESNEAWLKTPETYYFTALSVIEGVKCLRDARPAGAVSPSMAFGNDFVCSIKDVERFDRLE
jgi:short subunit dehydrogenase-like uncharacterized protein